MSDGLIELSNNGTVLKLKPIESIEERSKINSLVKSILNRHSSLEAERRRIKSKLGRPVRPPSTPSDEEGEEDEQEEPEQWEVYEEVEDADKRMELIEQLDQLNQMEEEKSNKDINDLVNLVRPKVKEGSLEALGQQQLLSTVVTYIGKHSLSNGGEQEEGDTGN